MLAQVEELSTEIRARIAWGERPESVRQWMLVQNSEIDDVLLEEILKDCVRLRALSMRRTGIRRCILGLLLLVPGLTLATLLFRNILAGSGGSLSLIGFVAGCVASLVGSWCIVHGLEQVVFGARAEGSESDNLFA